MDWQVLDWNSLARDFYQRRDGKWLREWLVYRIDYHPSTSLQHD
jgi:hypothetical protein